MGGGGGGGGWVDNLRKYVLNRMTVSRIHPLVTALCDLILFLSR